MRDLDWLGEIGPRLSISLIRAPSRGNLRLDLNARAVFSTDLSSVGFQGYVFNPALVWQKRDVATDGLDLQIQFSSVFATERFQDYFYEVRARDVRSGRREYDADGGYLGSFLDIGLRYPLTSRLRAAVGTRLGYFDGAANESSPLHRENLNVSVGASLIITLLRSDERVPTGPESSD
jgi:hypothetical protein